MARIKLQINKTWKSKHRALLKCMKYTHFLNNWHLNLLLLVLYLFIYSKINIDNKIKSLIQYRTIKIFKYLSMNFSFTCQDKNSAKFETPSKVWIIFLPLMWDRERFNLPQPVNNGSATRPILIFTARTSDNQTDNRKIAGYRAPVLILRNKISLSRDLESVIEPSLSDTRATRRIRISESSLETSRIRVLSPRRLISGLE